MVDSSINKFLDGYSIEVTPNAAAKIDNFSDVLPNNTRIYIAHIEGTPIEDLEFMVVLNLTLLLKLKKAILLSQ